MPRAKILPRAVSYVERVSFNLRAFTSKLFNSLFAIKTALRIKLPVAVLLALLGGCEKPGTVHLSYENAKDQNKAAAELFKLACPHIKDVRQEEMDAFRDRMNKLNLKPLETPWVALRGANYVPPACPTRSYQPDAAAFKPDTSKPVIQPDGGLPAIQRPKDNVKKPIKPEKPDEGVTIKP